MLKAGGSGTKNGKPVKLIVLGLSHQNLQRLKDRQPIKIHGMELGLVDTEILIFAGATEQSMARELQELIGPQTKTSIDPRFKD